MRFVLIDESVVDRGWYALVSGIDLRLFKKNPVMFWNHRRPRSWDSKDEERLPIGRWDDIKIEEIKGIKSITAEAVFDEEDEFALKIKKKVDNNFLRMASVGLIPITISDDAKFIKKGQTRSTLVKSELREASIVDIGGNKNAIRLYDENREIINLSDDENSIIPTLNKQKNNNMKDIALKLGLKEGATETEVLAAIEILLSSEKTNKDNLEKLQSERIEILLKSEAITDDNKKDIEDLAKLDFNLALKMVKSLEGRSSENKTETIRLSSAINKTKTGKSNETKVKTWEEHSDKELQELKSNKIDEYIELYSGYFGYPPVIN